MKILIMTDLEGCAGVAADRQLNGVDNPYYRKARAFQAAEIQAAILGALDAGAGEFVVCDGHGMGFDMMFDFESLHPAARFITGTGCGFPYLRIADEGFSAGFLVGQHPRRGPRGSLEHTGSNLINQGTWLNGVEVGEAGAHAAAFGEMGFPLALLTGDEEAVLEAEAFGCGTVGVAVKRGLLREQCVSLHPGEACRRIREGAARAVRELPGMRSWRLPPPNRLRIRYGSAACAEKYAPLDEPDNILFPYIQRLDADTVEVSGRTIVEILRRYDLMNRVL
jgi:D-amino peptidase